jgi:hypothetical protein
MGFSFGDIFSEIKDDVGQVGHFGLDVFKQTQAVPLAVIGGATRVGSGIGDGVGKAVGGIGNGLGGLAGGLGGTLQYLPIILIGGAVIFGIVELKKAMK